jgi:hypothetical protein
MCFVYKHVHIFVARWASEIPFQAQLKFKEEKKTGGEISLLPTAQEPRNEYEQQAEGKE